MKGGDEGSNGGEEGRGWGDVMVRVLQPGGRGNGWGIRGMGGNRAVKQRQGVKSG